MQFTVESNHSMDKNCFKFMPIALFSCRYKRKIIHQTLLLKQNFITHLLLFAIHKTAKIINFFFEYPLFLQENQKSPFILQILKKSSDIPIISCVTSRISHCKVWYEPRTPIRPATMPPTTKHRFSKGEWVEALDQAAMFTVGYGRFG